MTLSDRIVTVSCTALFGLSSVALAQRPSVRMPVEVVDRGGAVQTEDPSGNYEGQVNGYIAAGFSPGFYDFGDWSFSVRTMDCQDCLEGQYVLSLTYLGLTYLDRGVAVQESGYGGGVLNPNTGVINFTIFASNCATMTDRFRSFSRSDPGILKGTYFGGHDGEAPADQVRITPTTMQNRTVIPGRIIGRLSGRDCLDQSIFADVSLAKQ
jgi:hypothetical protein